MRNNRLVFFLKTKFLMVSVRFYAEGGEEQCLSKASPKPKDSPLREIFFSNDLAKLWQKGTLRTAIRQFLFWEGGLGP